MSLSKLLESLKGSSSSGNFGHEGRPGKKGGSGPGELMKGRINSFFIHVEEGKTLKPEDLGLSDTQFWQVRTYLKGRGIVDRKGQLTETGKVLQSKVWKNNKDAKDFVNGEFNNNSHYASVSAYLYEHRAGTSTMRISDASRLTGIDRKPLMDILRKAESKGLLGINQIADLDNVSFRTGGLEVSDILKQL